MKIIIADNLHVYFDNITTAEEDILWKELSASDPNAYVSPDQYSMWDGVYRKYNRARRRTARPLLGVVEQIAKQYDLPLQIEDHRDPWQYEIVSRNDIDKSFLPGITLDDHQLLSIQKIARNHWKNECGIVCYPTGGGKGEAIAGFCKAIKCPTVVIADQTVVIDQLKARLELRNVAEEIGLFYAGKRPNGEMVVVGSIQSLSPPTTAPPIPHKGSKSDEDFDKEMQKWELQFRAFKTRKKNSKYLLDYIKKAEMILVDEVDKAASEQYKKLFRHYFKGRRRYGFSGTPEDPDKPVENLVIKEHVGPIIIKISRKYLEDIGRIIRCRYRMMAVEFGSTIKDASAYDIARDEYITNNPSFHDLVGSICQNHKGEGTIVLVDREPLGFALQEKLSSLNISSNFIYGKTPKNRRDQALRSFERREYDVLIGGKIINRGMDLKGGCENLIIATGGKLRSDLMQKIGRALRINSKGESLVYDFFFRCNKHLYNHSKKRLEFMVAEGYDCSVIFNNGEISGKQLIESKYRVPNKYK